MTDSDYWMKNRWKFSRLSLLLTIAIGAYYHWTRFDYGDTSETGSGVLKPGSRISGAAWSQKYMSLSLRFLSKNEMNEIVSISELSGEYEEVPDLYPMEGDTSHQTRLDEILFVLTTNTQRILDTIHELKFWSKQPAVKCLIIFEEKDLTVNSHIRQFLLNEGIPCHIRGSNVKRYEQRYFQMIEQSWRLVEEQSLSIRWLAVCDDDTLWFTGNLLKILQQYNASELIYLGNISDRLETLYYHGGYYAYGGAGILLSRALVPVLLQSMKECQRRFSSMFGGDEILGKCLTQICHINLTRNMHFHQMDHEGNLVGYLQGGINDLVSLHHLFTLWEPFPSKHASDESQTMSLLLRAYQAFCGGLFKRYRKLNAPTNQTYLLTLGYSLTVMDGLLTMDDLSKVEQTWCCSRLSTRLTRSKEKGQIHWFFLNASSTSARSTYRNFQKGFSPQYSIVEILVH